MVLRILTNVADEAAVYFFYFNLSITISTNIMRILLNLETYIYINNDKINYLLSSTDNAIFSISIARIHYTVY